MKKILTVLIVFISFTVVCQTPNPNPPVIDSISVGITSEGIYHNVIGWETYDWSGYDLDSSGFMIYDVFLNQGYQTIDTIPDPFATFYIDSTSNPEQEIRGYGLAAYSIINGKTKLSSISDQFSRNMLLEVDSYDSCLQSVSLTWNTYFRKEAASSSTDPIYKITAQSDSDQQTAQSTINSHTFYGLNQDEIYTFRININNEDFSSTSNPIQQNINPPDSTTSPAFIDLTTNSTFANNITVEIDPINTGELLFLRSNEASGPFDTIERAHTFSSSNITYIDTKLGQKVGYYNLVAKNICLHSPMTSDTINNILLQAEMMKDFVGLEANEELRYDSVYELHRNADGETISIDTYPPIEYNDFDVMNLTLQNPLVTYFVEIVKNSTVIRSNPVTLTIQDDLLWPNAIVAGDIGIDGYFRAFIKKSVPESFSMKIFNKWGELIFESFDIESAWDATYKGEIVPSGAYLYVATYKFSDRNEEIAKGTVTVIH